MGPRKPSGQTKSPSRKAPAPTHLLVFNFTTGDTSLISLGTKKRGQEDYVVTAASLAEAAHLDYNDVTKVVRVDYKQEWYAINQSILDRAMATDAIETTPQDLSDAVQTLFQRRVDERKHKNLPTPKAIKGQVYWEFKNRVPVNFRIFLGGPIGTWQQQVPAAHLKQLKSLKNRKKPVTFGGCLEPNNLVFIPGKAVTEWTEIHEAGIAHDATEITADEIKRLRVRYKLASTVVDPRQQRLRIELLILPADPEEINQQVEQGYESTSFPGIPIMLRSNPIKWFNDRQNFHHQFTTPTFRFLGDWENLEGEELEAAKEDAKVVLTNETHARLLYEVEKEFSATQTPKHPGQKQLAHLKNLIKDPQKVKHPTLPNLCLSNQEEYEGDAANTSDVTIDSDEENDPAHDGDEEDNEIQPELITATPDLPPELNADSSMDSEDEVIEVPRGEEATGTLLTEDSFEDEESPEPEQIPVIDLHPGIADPTYGIDNPTLGKTGLFKAGFKPGTRYTDPIPITDQHLLSLKQSHPSATTEDLKSILSIMGTSMTKAYKSSVKSATNAITKVMGNTDWLTNPQEGDRAIILSRLAKTKLKNKTAIQYLKTYETALNLNGKTAPPTSAVFRRMKTALLKNSVNPVDDIVAQHRKAYSLDSLRLASSAFAAMANRGFWSSLKAQQFHTILVLAFWGRFRMGEILPTANNNVIREETLLLLDVKFHTDADNKLFLRIWLRKEKAVSGPAGNVIEIPKLPKHLADICAYRAMKSYVEMAKTYGLDTLDPLFTRPDHTSMTGARFKKGVDFAIAQYLPNNKELYADLKNHSLRSGIPTMCQENDIHIDEDILKLLGRWSSPAYKAYMKSFEGALKARKYMENTILSQIDKTSPTDTNLNNLPAPRKAKPTNLRKRKLEGNH